MRDSSVLTSDLTASFTSPHFLFYRKLMLTVCVTGNWSRTCGICNKKRIHKKKKVHPANYWMITYLTFRNYVAQVFISPLPKSRKPEISGSCCSSERADQNKRWKIFTINALNRGNPGKYTNYYRRNRRHTITFNYLSYLTEIFQLSSYPSCKQKWYDPPTYS